MLVLCGEFSQYTFMNRFINEVEVMMDEYHPEEAFIQVAKQWIHKRDCLGRSIAFYLRRVDNRNYLEQLFKECNYNFDAVHNFGLTFEQWNERWTLWKQGEANKQVAEPDASTISVPTQSAIYKRFVGQ
jgi:hypothetical protein